MLPLGDASHLLKEREPMLAQPTHQLGFRTQCASLTYYLRPSFPERTVPKSCCEADDPDHDASDGDVSRHTWNWAERGRIKPHIPKARGSSNTGGYPPPR